MIRFLFFTALLAASDVPPPGVNPQTYLIGPEDVLAVHVWKEPEVSCRVPVRPDGRISLPLLNDVPAAGLTPTELARRLSVELKKYLTEADVTVVVEQVNSKKFYVMGEVSRAGAYPLLAATSVLQALSAAGGFRDFANTKRIYVLKGSGPSQRRLPFDYKAVVQGKKPEQNVLLEHGDTIVVP
ncbi:MAG: polysaccharide biosynthesis/export family protein [Acidobacteria bacterium]|nr:polysaccharide biosynthesis/export family protein [Acidobacteriota bacterium]